MKKLLFTLLFLMIAQLDFANINDSILVQARNFASKGNYTEAIKSYKDYIKNNVAKNNKDIYIELANTYYKNNDNKNAVATIKEAILKSGFVESDFIYNQLLLPKLSDLALSELYEDLGKLENKYLATLE